MDERVRIDATTEEEYSARTPEEVARRIKTCNSRRCRLHQEINIAYK
jgi:hypothetical protein